MNYLPTTYPTWNNFSQQMMPQQQQSQGLIWVDGEAAAKSYQMPAGWPANTPLALWDTNDTIIYLKSTNQMGMPNPLQKAHYQLETMVPKRSGAAGREDYTEQSWAEEFRSELKSLKEEIDELKRREEK